MISPLKTTQHTARKEHVCHLETNEDYSVKERDNGKERMRLTIEKLELADGRGLDLLE